jgi:hypothetical protein
MNGDEASLGFAFPELYRWWKDHDLKHHEDLGSIRPWFYEGLNPEDELSLGGGVYLEFRPFQEIVITEEGVAREIEVPEFVLEVSGAR